MKNEDCIFCKIIKKKIPADIEKETDNIIILKDIAPNAPIHYLIIPKKHFKDIRSATGSDFNLIKDCFLVAKELSKEIKEFNGDFKIRLNNGYAAGQRVFHLHFHFLAGKEFKLTG